MELNDEMAVFLFFPSPKLCSDLLFDPLLKELNGNGMMLHSLLHILSRDFQNVGSNHFLSLGSCTCTGVWGGDCSFVYFFFFTTFFVFIAFIFGSFLGVEYNWSWNGKWWYRTSVQNILFVMLRAKFHQHMANNFSFECVFCGSYHGLNLISLILVGHPPLVLIKRGICLFVTLLLVY